MHFNTSWITLDSQSEVIFEIPLIQLDITSKVKLSVYISKLGTDTVSAPRVSVCCDFSSLFPPFAPHPTAAKNAVFSRRRTNCTDT